MAVTGTRTAAFLVNSMLADFRLLVQTPVPRHKYENCPKLALAGYLSLDLTCDRRV